jgi:hypothetical protein
MNKRLWWARPSSVSDWRIFESPAKWSASPWVTTMASIGLRAAGEVSRNRPARKPGEELVLPAVDRDQLARRRLHQRAVSLLDVDESDLQDAHVVLGQRHLPIDPVDAELPLEEAGGRHRPDTPVRLLLEISDLDLDLGRGSVEDTGARSPQARSVRGEPSSRRNTAKSTLIAKSSATADPSPTRSGRSASASGRSGRRPP